VTGILLRRRTASECGARSSLAALAALAALLIGAGGTGAVPPGANGAIAFVSREDGAAALFTMNPDGSDRRRLMSNGPLARNPAWSPDGRRIAFLVSGPRLDWRTSPDELWIARADGSDRRRIATNAGYGWTGPAWSPDGRRIAFPCTFGGHQEDLCVVGVAGGAVRRLTKTPQDEGSPAWSPTGRWIAFHRFGRDRSRGELYATNPAGTRVRPLTRTPAIVEQSPSWSRKGEIAFAARRRGSGDSDVFVMRPDGTRRNLTRTPRSSEYDPAWSPDGRRIVFGDASAGGGLSIVGRGGGAKRKLQLRLDTPPPRGASNPAWSPDGKQILFNDSSILVVNAAGGSVTRVLHAGEAGEDREPAWSPDGRTIAYGHRGPVPSGSANGVALLPIERHADSPTWAPDGKRFAAEYGLDSSLVGIFDLATGEWTELLRDEGAGDSTKIQPAWSPDGRLLAFAYYQDSPSGIGLLDLTSGAEIPPLTEDDDSRPAWSPDGTQIVFERGSALFVIRLDGRRVRRLTARGSDPAWSPDGTTIAFVRTDDGDAEIYAINADGTGERRLTNNSWDDFNPDWQPLPRSE
jgi:TolB protein